MSWLDKLFQSTANPSATGATQGIVLLAGDLAGTGGTAATPRVSGITGLNGVGTVTATHFDYTGNAKGTPRTDEAFVQTIDATANVLLYSWTLANNAVTCFDSITVAIRSDKGAGAVLKRSAYFRNNAGTVSQMGSTVDNGTQKDDTNWSIAVDFTGTTGRLRVTGVAATTITWFCIVQITEVIP